MTHIPVMLQEVLTGLRIQHDGVYLDCTFGRGGHAMAILSRLGQSGRLIAIDRDPEAIDVGRNLESRDSRLKLFHLTFSALDQALEFSEDSKLDGILMDLGVSSPQLDEAARGFSFQNDGPLDMRMDPTRGQSAANWLASAEVEEIADVLWVFGEERFSRRIARAIVTYRKEIAIETTLQLAKIIIEAQPRKDQRKHPATRSFQAIRLFINEELLEIEIALHKAIDVLNPGGRLAIISFHSLEDRLVKRYFRKASKPPIGDPRMPLPLKTPNPKLKLVSGAIKAGNREIEINPRARSAVLRVAERMEAST